MLRRTIFALVVALGLPAGAAAPALAHEGDPNFLSRVDGVTPRLDGVRVVVLNRDDRIEITNRSSKTIVIEGYNDEPYARLRADGAVEVNQRSPARYLNEERDGEVDVPAGIDGKGAPQWRLLDKTGRFEFHDHRMHWMAEGRPKQVKDPDRRTTVFRWKVPIDADGQRGAIAGTLFWTPEPGGGVPTGALIAGVAIVALLAALVVVVRRRRADEGGDGAGGSPPQEAW